MARVATATQFIVSGTLEDFATVIEMGPPLHSLALCGSLHEIEEQMYEHFLFTKPEIQARIAEYTQIAQAAEQEENKDDNSD